MTTDFKTLLARALRKIDELESELSAERSRKSEPMAVIGLACRFPGGSTPEALWETLEQRRDMVREIPHSRAVRSWPEGAPRWAGLLDEDPDRFDAAFFGIAPREALSLDPQQRLLLEVSWEALERAGIVPGRLHGSRTGVFVGLCTGDYLERALLRPAEERESYDVTGNMASTAAGRISYTLGLQGPAVTLDTACSSSLAAIHLACHSLRAGESDLALAGGVNLILSEQAMVNAGSTQAFSPDGRCKTFDASANGTVRGEGCGVVVLKRLSDARRDGDPVLALVRGSAMNQDGRSTGLTAPNVLAQEALLREALRRAGVEPHEVGYIECHGTGTSLGDPIETDAIRAVYGAPRSDGSRLWLGALKTNLGHLEAAAGVAGLIKVVLAMQHRRLPANLHLRHLNPRVKLAGTPISPLSEAVAWQPIGRRRVAGVSGFGISGTNAHVVLEEAPAEPEAASPARAESSPSLLLLSGRTEAALRAQAERLSAHLAQHAELAVGDVAYSLATTRTHFEQRAAVVAPDRAGLLEALGAVAQGKPGAGIARGEARAGGKVVFVFPGQGSQWAGMGRALLETSGVFRQQMAACERALSPHVDWSLGAVVRGEPGAPSLERVDVVQPALFAMMVSLAGLWRSLGVVPDVVVGHSQGEIAAACVAGALTLEDGAKVVAVRSRALRRLSGRGAMAAVELAAAELSERLVRWGERLSVAALNGPRSTVVSGEPEAVDELLRELEEAGVFGRKVRVDIASHSAQMAGLREELTAQLQGLSPRASAMGQLSTVTLGRLWGAELDAGYWYRNLREPVRFAEAVEALVSAGHRFFVEVSPHPVLAMAVEGALQGAGQPGAVVGSLRRDEGEMARLLLSLGELHSSGLPVDWSQVLPRGRRVLLPTCAFQRERYWIEAPEGRRGDAASAAAPAADQAFWEAVEQGDPDALAQSLGADGAPERASLGALLPALAAYRRRQREQGRIDTLRYRVAWKPMSAPRTGDLAGTWLMLVPDHLADGERLSALARAFSAGGADLVLLRLTHEDADRDRLAARLREATGARRDARAAAARGVLSLLALDEAPLPQHPALPRGAAHNLALVQALGDAGIQAPLWLFTRGAVSIGRSERLESPLQAMTWGLGRVVALEHPERWGGLLDLPESIEDRGTERLAQALAGQGDEDQIALRTSGLFVRRLVRAPLDQAEATRAFAPRGAVLITGGTGGLGALLARWLAPNGAEHLILTSRRGHDAPGADALLAELTAQGARVTIAACDAADRDALASLIRRVEAEGPRIAAVIHAAGVGRMAPLAETTVPELAEAASGKALGAQHLHELFAERPLDAFVTFSSGAGVWGSSQQGAYAAANAFLDALCERRRALGQTGTSIAWGLWSGGGMGEGAAIQDYLRRRGFSAMPPALALAALQQALDHDETALAVADLDWARFAPAFAAARARPLIADLPEARRALEAQPPASASAPSDGALCAALRGLTEGERLRHLTGLVQAQAAAVLGHTDASRLDPHTGFLSAGLDSLMAVELRRRLQQATGLKMPATLAFDHPTPHHVARFLRDALAPVLGEARRGEVEAAPASAVAASREPIAIVGAGLRLPGGVLDLDRLFRFLERGVDAVGPVPAGRWDADAFYDPDPEAKGKSYVREAAFLDHIDRFDAAFFGISPREAKNIDPRHRLLLETAWHALEDAEIVPSSLGGSRTGVFVGTTASDYETLQRSADEAEAYIITGTHPSFAAGRLSFTLGLQGPALSVDTACSSSLVALHLACQALRRGECDLALCAGVQVMADPEAFVVLSRTRAVAPDGRSKTFSASADGYGRGEGAVVFLLERLSDARARGRRILAVVRGTAVNHDGASSGITAPNGTSQQKVLRAALEDAGLAPGDVDVAECHGTGTSLGDPIEVQALAEVYGEGRAAGRPLLLGALKTNIGHLEPASGLAGVAKMVASLQRKALPATLHTHPRNPHIDWAALPVEVVDAPRPWPEREGGGPRRAGVSAFGLSGTNAHVILEEVPVPQEAPAEASAAPPTVLPLLVSGKTKPALRAQAERLRAHLLSRPDLAMADVARSLATTRTHFEQRAAVIAEERDAILEALDAIAHDRPRPGPRGEARGGGKLALLFTGQGSQRPGVGRALYERFAAFRDALDAACAHFDPALDRPLREVLFAPEGSPDAARLDQTAFTQPALFALEVALFRLFSAHGLMPDLLLGHSIGEIVAAHVAGVLSLEDACALVAARARLMQALPEGGAMVSLQAAEDEVRPLVAGREAQVDIAAINGPASTVIAGDEGAVLEIEEHVRSLGRKTSRLAVSHAFHSPRMEAMLASFGRVADKLTFRPPTIPIVSNVTGRRASAEELASPAYWVRHARQAVRFLDGVRALEAEGASTFLELGPQGVLCALGRDCLSEDAAPRASFTPALRKDRPEIEAVTSALAALHVRGHALDWEAFFAPIGTRRAPLPLYAFQGERHWLDAAPPLSMAQRAPAGRYPLSGERLDLPDGSALHTVLIGPGVQGYLADHLVYGRIVVPGAFQLATLLAVADAHWPDRPVALSDVEFLQPLVFDRPSDRVLLHIQLSPADGVDAGFRATISTRRSDAFTIHVRATLGPAAPLERSPRAPSPAPAADLGAAPLAALDAALRSLQVDWGPRWWWLREAAPLRPRAGFGRFKAPEGVPQGDAPIPGGLIDNAFSLELWSGAAGSPGGAPRPPNGLSAPRLPFSVERFVWNGRAAAPASAELVLRDDQDPEADVRVADVSFWDESGLPVARIEGLTNRRAPKERLLPEGARGGLYVVAWVDPPDPTSPPQAGAGVWAVLGRDALGLSAALAGAAATVEHHGDLAALRAAIDGGAPAPEVVVVSWTSGAEELAVAAHGAAHRALALLQQWLADERLASSRLVLVTRRAVAARPDEGVLDLAHAPLWGLARTAQSEAPDRAIVLVDLDEHAASRSALPSAVAAGEGQVAVRGGALLVPRLVRASAAVAAETGPWDERGTFLVTGGTGGLGALIARHLVERHGVRSVVLASRKGRSAPGADALAAELSARGARVTVAACDVADRDAISRLLASIPTEHPLAGVIHAAGVLHDGVLHALDPERMDRVLSPKVDGALHLHELTRHLDLAVFALFSSLSGVLGAAGQGSYAAANAFLDALASHRCALGLPAVSLAYGPFAQVGMAARLSEQGHARARRGAMPPLSPEDGLALFDAALGHPSPCVAPTRIDTAALSAQAGPVPPLLQSLVRSAPRRAAAASGRSAGAWKHRLALLPEAEREGTLLDLIRGEAAIVLGGTLEAMDPDRPLQELGLDSLMAVELRGRLAAAAGLRLPATLLFNHPTPAALARLLGAEMFRGEPTNGAPVLGELDRVEAALLAMPPDEAARAHVAARLRALLSRWTDASRAPAPPAPAPDLHAATNDELFGLIDREIEEMELADE
ncbi:SDR family NAD(P)-dependent oxidoreductase [Sorangium sp. So ce315]|uniref:type I polyketide synthase n=1 Tax=Sorangium sp. So ce315 TaxID=3133299 RepID=UPI003F5FF582